MNKLSILFIFFLISCTLPANYNANPSGLSKEDLVFSENAEDLFKEQKYNEAAALYKELSDKDATGKSDFMYAESLRLNNKPDDSIKYYDIAIQKNYSIYDSMEGKALAFMSKNKLDEAEEIFSEILRKDASRWRSINALGVISSINGKNNEALEYYKLALDIKPSATILNNIGLAIGLSGDTKLGLSVLDEAATMAQNNKENLKQISLNKALVYGFSNDMDSAEIILKKYLTEAEVYNNLGFYAKLNNNTELAKNYLSMSIARSPVYYQKAWENLQTIR